MQYKNIEEFYSSLSEEILDKAFELEYSSKIKKSINSVKKKSTKLKYILDDKISKQKFVDFLYSQYKVADLEYKNFADVLTGINKDNITESIIYVIHEYLESNNLSRNFNVVINKADEIQKNSISNNKTKDNENNINKEEEMNDSEEKIKNIVVLNKKGEFYNIYPLAEIKNDSIKMIEKNERQEKYPSFGNINIYTSYNSNLRKNNIDENELKILIFSKNDLKDTGQGSKYQINEKYLNSNNFYNIERDNIFEVIDILEDTERIENKLKKKEDIIVNNYSSNKIYIKNTEYIYGPFRTKDIKIGYKLLLDRDDYLVEKYSINENKGNIILGEIQGINYNESIKNIVYFKSDNIVKEEIDIINDQELLELLKEKIGRTNTTYTNEEMKKIRENIISIINNELSNSRIIRIKTMISQTELTDAFILDELVNIIGELIDTDKGKKVIVNKILDNNDNLRKLQNYNIVENKINNKKNELQDIELQIKDRQIELENLNLEIEHTKNEREEENINNIITQNNIEIAASEKRKKELEEKIFELETRYNLMDEYIKIKEKADEEENRYQTFSAANQKWKREISNLEDNFKRKLTEATKSCDSIAFDLSFEGLIANEMMKKSAEWAKKVSDDEFKGKVIRKEEINSIINFKNENDVIDYIYKKVKVKRNYTKNEIINFMLCINQGFLTVFVGEPGVGKTSLCNIIAETLGLIKNNYQDRYVEVSVEKGWTSKRDFIGYYNPLTREFDKNNNLLYSAFNILNKEYENKIEDIPFYILLDEANLSPMEHYWADFMNACDMNKDNRNVNLGDGYLYNIPNTLRFLATINYDHTTENLSPRLIDRAWIISLDEEEIIINKEENIKDEDNNYGIITFEDIKNVFSYDNSKSYNSLNETSHVLEEIYSIFKENGISISPRIQKMIDEYLSVGYELFENTDNTAKEFVALDYAISQKLLPKVDGYGESYKRFLESIEDIFDKNNMMKCKKITRKILDKGDKNMQYYQFFI